jgi:hypothetical protein
MALLQAIVDAHTQSTLNDGSVGFQRRPRPNRRRPTLLVNYGKPKRIEALAFATPKAHSASPD